MKAPGYGDRRKRMLEDIAILTGGQVAMKELGVELTDVTAEMLGRAKSVKITKDNTTIVDGAGSKEAIEDRISQIKGEIEHTDSDFDKEKLQERMRGYRGRAEGDQAPHRGRAAGNPCRRRGGHRRWWRRCVPGGRQGAGRRRGR